MQIAAKQKTHGGSTLSSGWGDAKSDQLLQRHLFDDLQTVTVETYDLPGAVGEQTDPAQTQDAQDLGARPVIAKAHGRNGLIGPGLQALEQHLARIRRFHVHERAPSGTGDGLERSRERPAAAEALGAE